MNDKKEANIKNWVGLWNTSFSNGFHHQISFQAGEGNLIGKYQFNKTIKLQLQKIVETLKEPGWVQTNENGIFETGVLTFVLESSHKEFSAKKIKV